MARVRAVICQFDGIDHTPALPLAAGVLVASARKSPRLAGAATFAIEVARQPLDDLTGRLAGADVIGLSLYPWNVACLRAHASTGDLEVVPAGALLEIASADG